MISELFVFGFRFGSADRVWPIVENNRNPTTLGLALSTSYTRTSDLARKAYLQTYKVQARQCGDAVLSFSTIRLICCDRVEVRLRRAWSGPQSHNVWNGMPQAGAHTQKQLSLGRLAAGLVYSLLTSLAMNVRRSCSPHRARQRDLTSFGGIRDLLPHFAVALTQWVARKPDFLLNDLCWCHTVALRPFTVVFGYA